MTNLVQKARAGRIKALKNRPAKKKEAAPLAMELLSSEPAIRVDVPVFMSARTRAEAPVYLH